MNIVDLFDNTLIILMSKFKINIKLVISTKKKKKLTKKKKTLSMSIL